MKSLPVICLSLITMGTALPQTPAAAGRFTLENRSSFTPERNARNPFWPIGWSPVSEVQEPDSPAPAAPAVLTVPRESLVVSSTLLGSPSLAIVNGRELTIGDTLTVPVGGGQAQLRVIRIGDGFVDFEHLGKLIRATVP